MGCTIDLPHGRKTSTGSAATRYGCDTRPRDVAVGRDEWLAALDPLGEFSVAGDRTRIGRRSSGRRCRAGADELNFREPRRRTAQQGLIVAAQMPVEEGPQIPPLDRDAPLWVDGPD